MKIDAVLEELKIPREAYRELIMSIAEERGLLDHGGRGCLDLARYHGKMGSDFDADAEQLMIAWCPDFADAAGGLLGLRSARHDAEHAALKTIAAAVDVRNAKHWRAFLDQTSGA